MLFCTTHGRAHYPGEQDDCTLLGDDLLCREEEWPVVEGQAVGRSHCEQSTEPFYTVSSGTLAYLDTLASGLVPVKVEAIGRTERSVHAATVKVTAARPGYARGEVIEVNVPSMTLVSRTQVYRANGQLRVAGPVRFVTDAGDLV